VQRDARCRDSHPAPLLLAWNQQGERAARRGEDGHRLADARLPSATDGREDIDPISG